MAELGFESQDHANAWLISLPVSSGVDTYLQVVLLGGKNEILTWLGITTLFRWQNL